MSYKNTDQEGRLVIIDVAENLFAEVSTLGISTLDSKPFTGWIESVVECSKPPVYISQSALPHISTEQHPICNMPFLFSMNGLPWREANSYLMHIVDKNYFSKRPTDKARKAASRLLTYKMFCERNSIDWLDFSAKRRSMRPTYRYWTHLLTNSQYSPKVINQITGVIYDFYKFISERWHHIDMERVDSTTTLKMMIEHANGSFIIEKIKRSQTRPTPDISPVPIGYVREYGENLRPLTSAQLNELLEIVNRSSWNATERLIVQFALFTGARKQTVLTLRLNVIEKFQNKYLNKDNTYTVHAGSGTAYDTKYSKTQQLFVPRQLADELRTYASSDLARVRRYKYLDRYKKDYPDLELPKEQDVYLFLSDQGNTYYMSKTDPRYPFVRSPQVGQVTHTIKRKLLRDSSYDFPKDFSFHWLRASYAFQYYLWLLPLIEKGLSPAEQISMIQRRLHHKSRETTENYLKLFLNIDEKLFSQELYEGKIFDCLNNPRDLSYYGK